MSNQRAPVVLLVYVQDRKVFYIKIRYAQPHHCVCSSTCLVFLPLVWSLICHAVTLPSCPVVNALSLLHFASLLHLWISPVFQNLLSDLSPRLRAVNGSSRRTSPQKPSHEYCRACLLPAYSLVFRLLAIVCPFICFLAYDGLLRVVRPMKVFPLLIALFHSSLCSSSLLLQFIPFHVSCSTLY